MAQRRRNSAQAEPPQGLIRQSQMVTTFGPGAMVDLLHDAVLIGGLDLWALPGGRHRGDVIDEPRLRTVVMRALKQHFGEEAQSKLSHDRPFRAPPVDPSDLPTRAVGVKAFEFPRWFVCQSCRALVRKDQLTRKGNAYQHACENRRTSVATPVRFVVACTRGHLDDFPWRAFVHHKADMCTSPQLRLDEGSSGDFAEVIVSCESCGRSRPLSQAKVEMGLPRCRGERPWLGVDTHEECDEHQRLIVRTASNSYFPQTLSALTIPDPDDPIRHKVEQVYPLLENASAETLPLLRSLQGKLLADLAGFSDAEILRSLDAIRTGGRGGDAQLRTPEFERFMDAPLERIGELPRERDDFFVRRAAREAALPAQIDRVVLAAKLREVRALIGFTRLEGATATLQGEFDLGVRLAPISTHANYLPATEVHGEGVFVALSQAELAAWEARPEVLERARALESGYRQWAGSHPGAPKFPGVRFYLLHTLSHMLITALSLECGYAASAIRERIYCSLPNEQVPMAAILLSTGTTGSEGTLGGLVEQGRRIGQHLRRAWDLATLCSSDPVCAHHNPDGDYAERYLTGAACHGCLFIAESSCERFNQYLDRALVVPVIGRPRALAFFSQRP